jgi:hypothetical protein
MAWCLVNHRDFFTLSYLTSAGLAAANIARKTLFLSLKQAVTHYVTFTACFPEVFIFVKVDNHHHHKNFIPRSANIQLTFTRNVRACGEITSAVGVMQEDRWLQVYDHSFNNS